MANKPAPVMDAELAELLAAASKGPWSNDECFLDDANDADLISSEGKFYQQADARLAALAPELAQELIRLRVALEVAQVWLDELREEFRRGALEDNAHRGGYLSNKNVEVEVQARKALAPRDD